MSWMLGGFLWLVLPLRLVIPGFIFISVFVTTAAMQALALEWLSPRAATIAAVLWGVNPYFAYDAQARNAYGELLAAAILPLLLLGYTRATEARGRSVPLLAVAIAWVWLSDVPVAIIAAYMVAILGMVDAVGRRSWRPVLAPLLSATVAFGLAAFCLVPVLAERAAISPDRMMFSYRDMRQTFPLIGMQAERVKINFLYIGGSLILIVAASRLWRARFRGYESVVLPAVVAILMMLPPAAVLWRHVPLLEYVQFPGRLLLLLMLADAVLCAVLLERLASSSLKKAAIAAFLLMAGMPFAISHKLNGTSVAEAVAAEVESGAGYFPTPEYWTSGIDMKATKQREPVAVVSGSASADVLSWSAEVRRVQVNAADASMLRFRLMYYPAWRADVNGRPEVPRRSKDGLVELPVPTGRSEVTLRFVRTADRTAGTIVSLVTLLALIAWSIRDRVTYKSSLRDSH